MASNQEDAKKLINYNPQEAGRYFPELAIVGKDGFLMESLADKVEGMEFFEDKIVELEAEDAFGKRVPGNLEWVKSRRFQQVMGKPPQAGAEYNDKKGRKGIVRKVGSGKALVDFNHPLAGKKVEYRLRVVDLIEEEDEKIRAFITRRLPGPIGKEFDIVHNEENETLDIGISQMVAYQLSQQQGGMFLKMGIARDLQEHLDYGTIRFFETFEKYEPPVMPETDENESEVSEDSKDSQGSKEEEIEEQ